MFEPLIEELDHGRDLSPQEIVAAVEALTDETVGPESKARFLIALAHKGETPQEIAGFARALGEKSLRPELDPDTRARPILDVCGTGGDHLNTFNISTAVGLLAAAVGVTVAKHGNRAVTSRSGSADVLEALGIRVDLTPEQASAWLSRYGFAFFFAPRYHPAFKAIGPARKLCAQQGERTIFNFLGPLLNPARPSAQLVGVPRPAWCEPVARVLQSLGVQRAMVVSGLVPARAIGPKAADAFLDELSPLGPSTVAEFYQERGFSHSTLDPAQFPVGTATLSDLAGGDRETNAEIIRRLFRGHDRGPKRQALLLNAGAALLVAGAARSITEGWDLAAAALDDGRAERKLAQLAAAQ